MTRIYPQKRKIDFESEQLKPVAEIFTSYANFVKETRNDVAGSLIKQEESIKNSRKAIKRNMEEVFSKYSEKFYRNMSFLVGSTSEDLLTEIYCLMSSEVPNESYQKVSFRPGEFDCFNIEMQAGRLTEKDLFDINRVETGIEGVEKLKADILEELSDKNFLKELKTKYKLQGKNTSPIIELQEELENADKYLSIRKKVLKDLREIPQEDREKLGKLIKQRRELDFLREKQVALRAQIEDKLKNYDLSFLGFLLANERDYSKVFIPFLQQAGTDLQEVNLGKYAFPAQQFVKEFCSDHALRALVGCQKRNTKHVTTTQEDEEKTK